MARDADRSPRGRYRESKGRVLVDRRFQQQRLLKHGRNTPPKLKRVTVKRILIAKQNRPIIRALLFSQNAINEKS